MRLIKKLVEQIEDEVSGAEGYAKCAVEHAESMPELARQYKAMARTEYAHAMELHKFAAIEISKAERAGAKPTQEMADKWEQSHEEYIERMAKVKSYLGMA